MKKFGAEPPASPEKRKAERPLPRFIHSGPRRNVGREIRLDRAGLYERLWSEPVATVAKAWGISDRGLAKACRRLKVPLPPRGYWAKVKAGREPRGPRLPKLPAGQAEEIVVWAKE